MVDKIVILAYGLFLMIGGYFGYVKAKSTVSLAMGIGSGLMMFLGLWLMTVNPKGAWIFLNCVSGFLVATFLLRVLKTHAFMPSGMLLAVSVASTIFFLLRLIKT
jgi:uncharacterized membrane protein (UPF0136 family)